MIIGVDFDNTIVGYDGLFHRLAVERGLVPPGTPVNKTAVRDRLRHTGNEAAWTELQGWAYGPHLREAGVFPGVQDFFRACRARGVAVRIISHKTRFPYAGEKHDLHAAARDWLAQQGFFSEPDWGITREEVFFELTPEQKLARIAAAGCTVFIDDLPEFLTIPEFPAGVRRILFDPAAVHGAAPGVERAGSWSEILGLVFEQDAGEGLTEQERHAAEALLRQIGRRLAGPPVRLVGGANNRVFEARGGHGERFLLKHYFHSAGDQRDRFEAERRFYRLAGVAAPGQTPRALGWDAAARLGLLEFVEGRRMGAAEIGAAEMAAARAFFAALNRDRERPEARALPRAAEACFTWEEHCQTVEGRVARLAHLPATTALEREAGDFVTADLQPAWRGLREALLPGGTRDRAPGEPLATGERCISPSDFGFHNAVQRPDGSIVFLDFEYAGWDDPAKMVCDFFCQPAVPVPLARFGEFADGVAAALAVASPGPFRARCRALLPLYRIKWCCILLNEFVRVDRGRRAFALGEAALEARKGRQLAAARQLLSACRNQLHETTA